MEGGVASPRWQSFKSPAAGFFSDFSNLLNKLRICKGFVVSLFDYFVGFVEVVQVILIQGRMNIGISVEQSSLRFSRLLFIDNGHHIGDDLRQGEGGRLVIGPTGKTIYKILHREGLPGLQGINKFLQRDSEGPIG